MMSTENLPEGGCQCGAVRFRTIDQTLRVIGLYCTTCKQRTSGTYGIGGYFNDEDVEFTQGTTRSFEVRSDESDRWLRNKFCGNCGSTVSWTLEL